MQNVTEESKNLSVVQMHTKTSWQGVGECPKQLEMKWACKTKGGKAVTVL